MDRYTSTVTPTPMGPPGTVDEVVWPTRLLQDKSQQWQVGLPEYVQPKGCEPPVMIAVGGGKGGVGKSMVSANLASRLAMSGKKVLAIDLDIGGANLHTYFGMNAPQYNLADAFVYERRTLAESMAQTPVNGVRLLAGGREEAWGGMSTIDTTTLRKLMAEILNIKKNHGIEFVIFDLGAGTNKITTDIFSIANMGLVTVLPEPTSIENAYLFLKSTLFGLIDNVGHRTNQEALAVEVKKKMIAGGAKGGYADRMAMVSRTHPQFIADVKAALAGRLIGFTVNQIRSQKDIDIGKSMEVIGNRYFGYTTRFSGFLNYDDAAWKSLRNRRMLLTDFPHAVLSRRFNDLVRTVLSNLGY